MRRDVDEEIAAQIARLAVDFDTRIIGRTRAAADTRTALTRLADRLGRRAVIG